MTTIDKLFRKRFGDFTLIDLEYAFRYFKFLPANGRLKISFVPIHKKRK